MGVVVEGDHLDVRTPAEIAEVTEAVGVDGVDQDQPADTVAVHVRGIHHRDGVGVQRLELADVAVDRAAEADQGLGVQLVCGHHGRERVEVGVGVGGDELGRAHACSIRGRPYVSAQALSSHSSPWPNASSTASLSGACSGPSSPGSAARISAASSRAFSSAARSCARRASLRSGTPA